MSEDQSLQPPIEVPLEKLPPEILRNIIESFILREGTDYGVQEVSVDKKIEQVHKQIKNKEVLVIFDFATETVNLITKTEWNKIRSRS